jgi:hypothetical protein
MNLNFLFRFPFVAVAAILILALAVGCGGDSASGQPVYSGSSIYLEDRDGQPVVVFEISISDGNGDPYTKGLLVESTAFTPDSSFPVLKANQGGKVTIILEASTPGDYRVAIESFIDPKGPVLLPAPDSTELGGKVLLTFNYAP